MKLGVRNPRLSLGAWAGTAAAGPEQPETGQAPGSEGAGRYRAAGARTLGMTPDWGHPEPLGAASFLLLPPLPLLFSKILYTDYPNFYFSSQVFLKDGLILTENVS